MEEPQTQLEQQLVNAARLGKFDLLLSTAKTLRTTEFKEALATELQEASAGDLLIELAKELVQVGNVQLAG